MKFELSGRVAVVTGALGRLGPVWCEALVSAGATVAGLDLAGIEPDARWRDLGQRWGERLTLHRADIRDRASLDQVAGLVARTAGPVTILVNNAGIDQPPAATTTYTLETIPPGVFREILDVNVVGAFQVIQAFGPGMIKAGRGSIINIGSLYASVSPDQRFYEHLPVDPPFIKPPAYGVSKAGLVNLTRYLAAHWGQHGVRVNALSPGGVLGEQDDEFKRMFTSRVPLGRMATADDLRGPLVFLASDASAYITGIDLRVDGGFTAW